MVLLLACVSAPDLPVAVDPDVNRRGSPGQSFAFSVPEMDGGRYTWSVDGEHYALVGQGTPNVVLIPEEEGDFALVAEVCDDLGCLTHEMFAFARTPWTVSGNAPVADAGPDQSAQISQDVYLDGTDSYDDEGDTLTGAWSFKSLPSGSTLTKSDISDRFSQWASFQPDVNGTYVVRFWVSDGTSYTTATATITVSATASNNPPVSRAGPDLASWLAYEVELDGTFSWDPDGDALTYRWGWKTLPSGSSLTNADFTHRYSSIAYFQPDVVGIYTAKLVAMDGTDQDVDFVDITVTSPSNYPPVADAGPDVPVILGGVATMDGSYTADADGDPLTYLWGFKSVPSGSTVSNSSWTGRYTTVGTFTPDVPGTYVVKLTADDGTDSDVDRADVTVTAATNGTPTAHAGPDGAGQAGVQVTLDGSSSSDPDGDPLTYRWGFKSLPTGSSLVNADIVDRYTTAAKFTPDVGGIYELRIVVIDDSGAQAVDTMSFDACSPTTWYPDSDGDGYGDPNISFSACSQATGTVADNTDCYDSNPDAFPGAVTWYSVDRGDGSFDYNCNKGEKHFYGDLYVCDVASATTCGDSTDGWITSDPGCGVAADYGSGCTTSASVCEPATTASVTQVCR